MTTIEPRDVRTLLEQLARISAATERIADALETMNANDPMTVISKAVGERETVPPERGSLLPESEMWRLR